MTSCQNYCTNKSFAKIGNKIKVAHSIARLFLFWYNLNVVKVADLAQLVERFPRKEKVASSILAISITKANIALKPVVSILI